MGNQCALESYDKNQSVKQQTVHQYDSQIFGFIRILRTINNKDIAIKVIHFLTQQQMKKYCQIAHRAKQYQNIPSLLKLYDVKIDSNITCKPYSVIIKFDFLNEHLGQILKNRKANLKSYFNSKRINQSNIILHEQQIVRKIKMNQYQKIDKLSYNNRKYINLFFLEAQILRMIDHVVGAIYFLNHFQSKHSAIRPENILVDQEGKYILIDRQVLKINTNYEQIIKNKKIINYISPQQFRCLQINQLQPKNINQLTDIYAVGMIALEMATLQDLNLIYDFKNLKLNKKQIERLINIAKNRYSDGFINLIQNMIAIQQNNRFNFSKLIDVLNPILTNNLTDMQKIYDEMKSNKNSTSNLLIGRGSQVSFKNQSQQSNYKTQIFNHQQTMFKKLNQIQQSYHKVMSNKILNNHVYNQESLKKDQQRILNGLKNINKKVNNVNNQSNKFIGSSSSKFLSNHQSHPSEEISSLQIGGQQLYQLYLKQYQSIKKSRQSSQ